MARGGGGDAALGDTASWLGRGRVQVMYAAVGVAVAALGAAVTAISRGIGRRRAEGYDEVADHGSSGSAALEMQPASQAATGRAAAGAVAGAGAVGSAHVSRSRYESELEI